MHNAESGRLLLLPYDTLTREPAHAMQTVYDFTGLPFRHDFENLSFAATEFDARLGMPGLHAKVAPAEYETILPPDLWRRHEPDSIWRDPAFNTRGMRVV